MLTLDRRRQALLSFSSGEDGGGVGIVFGLPITSGLVVHGVSSGLHLPGEGEPSLAGFARRSAVRLEAEMSDGSLLGVEPQLPPSGLERRFRWLKSLTFFNTFYGYGAKPLSISAFTADGRRLGTESLQR